MKKKPKTLDWTPNTPYKVGDIIHVDGAGYSYMVAGRKVKKSDWADKISWRCARACWDREQDGQIAIARALRAAARRGAREEREACARDAESLFTSTGDYIAKVIRASKAGK